MELPATVKLDQRIPLPPAGKGAETSRHIPTLDGWRAIAILLVVAHHLGTAFYTESDYYNIAPTRWGTWGVPVFFGLSGLLITKLLLEEFDRTGQISLKSFYIRRLFRIQPPAIVYILTVVALGLTLSHIETVSSFLFFRNYLPDSRAGLFTAHLWSLAVEEHFYLLWPGLLVLFSPRRGLAAAVALSFGFALWRSVDFHWHLLARALPLVAAGNRTDLRLDALFCGCAMAFLLNQQAPRDWLRRHYSFLAWIGVVAAFPLIMFLHPYLETFWLSWIIPFAMVGTVLHPEWAVSRILDCKPLKWIGRISYSLYLWQQLFLVPAWDRSPLGALQQWPLNVVLMMICCCASYYFIERPLIKVGHRIAKTMSAVRQTAAGAPAVS